MSDLIESKDVNTAEKSVDSAPEFAHSDSLNNPKYMPSKYNAFMRTFDGISLLVNLQSTPIAFVNTLGSALLTGGPRAVFWGPVIGWAVATCISGSLAEMASVEPYVGGQYIWVYTNAPPWFSKKGRLMLSHVQAYLTWIGWLLATAVLPTLMSGQIMELVEIYHPNVANWTLHQIGGLQVGIGCVIVLLCFWCTLNKYLRIVLRPLEVLGMILVFVIVIILIVVFPVMGERNSAHMAYLSSTIDQANTAWGNSGFAFCQGITLIFFMYTASDGIVHMAAEVKDSEVTVPKIIFRSTQIGALLSIPLAVLIPLFMGPLTDNVLSAPYPIIEILFDRSNSRPLVSCVTCLIILQTCPVACGAFATTSRLTLQLAQQGAMPEWWCQFWSLRGARGPLLFVCSFSVVLLLINIGSSVALLIMFSLATGFLVLSYGLLIATRIAGRISRGHDIRQGKWSMGKYGFLVNCIAAPPCFFIVLCQILPLFEPITASTFPYLGPSIAFVLLLSIVDNFCRGHAFNPIRNIRVANTIVEEDPTSASYRLAVV
ncbi:amino acid transporter [Viridothelium virens]|uniref:Amino acid transporter n=1 Tax=Viridothelium virens TaxID=1048519 RepID=A0A6A6H7B7_VIRVR|nr:amino acid transporter [Viridothelium virens]